MRVGSAPGSDAANEVREFRVVETIEEKMSGDEIVAGWPGRKIADVCEMKLDAIAELVAEGGRAPVGEFEHFAAGVNKIHCDVGV